MKNVQINWEKDLEDSLRSNIQQGIEKFEKDLDTKNKEKGQDTKERYEAEKRQLRKKNKGTKISNNGKRKTRNTNDSFYGRS